MHKIVTILLLASSAADSAIIQAAVELDGDSEDLIETLVDTVDMIIDPKKNDSRNATYELIYALLRTGPQITIKGNITDGLNEYSLSFTLNTRTAPPPANNKISVKVPASIEDEIWNNRSGVLRPVVEVVEPYLVSALSVLAQGILSGVVTHIMYETCILPDIHLA